MTTSLGLVITARVLVSKTMVSANADDPRAVTRWHGDKRHAVLGVEAREPHTVPDADLVAVLPISKGVHLEDGVGRTRGFMAYHQVHRRRRLLITVERSPFFFRLLPRGPTIELGLRYGGERCGANYLSRAVWCGLFKGFCTGLQHKPHQIVIQ